VLISVESATGCSSVRFRHDTGNPVSAPRGNVNSAMLMSPGTALEHAPVDADDVPQPDRGKLIAVDAATVVTVEYRAYY
jgi:hypothetical protein